jgi:peptidylprolyl isomerase
LGERGAAVAFASLSLAAIASSRVAPTAVGTAARQERAPDARPVDPAHQMSMVTLERGRGRAAAAGDAVRVRYVGPPPGSAAPGGAQDRGAPFDFVLGEGQVIEGWEEGVVGMQVGERRRLVIPPALAYGDRGREGVAPDATLVYEIELVAIEGDAHVD